ncbi:MAG: hypothetical protein GX102_04745 [Porphyromonadaceae bacterium]|nr:hypothetical protein [Porphyromonadaceae bacterium]
MKYLVTNAIIDLYNGDRIVSKQKILTENIEQARELLRNDNPDCKSIRLTYEQIPD